MDGSRFDALSRALAAGLSRRGLTRFLGGLALGGPLAAVGLRGTEGKRKKKKKVTLCHQGQTITVSQKARKGHLKHGDTLGACPTCTPNCTSKSCGDDGCGGSCGRCAADQACDNGQCVLSCPEGTKPCDGSCIASSQCCGDAECPVATPTCCGGRCVNTLNDAAYCGSCATPCRRDRGCQDGICVQACGNDICLENSATPNCCGETCTNLQRDRDHCGTCGSACSDGNVCVSGTCTCLPPTENLQTAIDATREDGALSLCAGTWVLPETLVIGKNLTLIGAGAGQSNLDGDEKVRVLKVTSGTTVTLKDLTVTRGRKVPFTGLPYAGAGIQNDGTLRLVRVSVTRNIVNYGYQGGGIYNTGTLELSNTSVTENKDAGFGGGIYNEGGTVVLKSGSVVAGHVAQHAGGIGNTGGTVTLEEGASVSDNAVSGAGGGILNEAQVGAGGVLIPGFVTLKAGSSVTNNTAGIFGGGIDNAYGTVTLEAGSTVSGNSAPNLGGGGVHNRDNATLVVDNTSIVTMNTPNNCAGAEVPPTCVD